MSDARHNMSVDEITGPFCSECRFYQPDGDDVFGGDCRRHAPRLAGMMAPHGNVQYQEPRSATWPSVERDDWCGEYQPRAALSAIAGPSPDHR